MRQAILLLAVLFLSIRISAQFTIILDSIPPNTPNGDPIHIAGDFQGWDPGSTQHILMLDSVSGFHQITLNGVFGNIEFKFTRGDWSKVEPNATGQFIPNRTEVATPNDTIYLQIEGWEDLNGGGNPGQSTADSNVHIVSDTFYMPQLNRYRRILIYLPPDYDVSGNSYPVLYMHDGQNLFDAYTSFAGEWEVDETLTAMYSSGKPGIIVVGIDNGGGFRADEYAPWINPAYGGGEGDLYLDFIVNTLKPYIDLNYRTLTDRDNTGIMGSSLGALISTYAGIRNPEVFGRIGAFSSAYWFNDPQIFDYIDSTGIPSSYVSRFYQNVGTQEGGTMVADMFRMQNKLIAAGLDSSSIISQEHIDGQHNEWFWAREFEPAINWLFQSYYTDIEDISSEEEFLIYPNPARDIVFIEPKDHSSTAVQLSVTGITGQKTILPIERIQVQDNLYKLDISALENGMYLLKLTSDKAQFTQRLIIYR
ncbi:MAG TPA: hypothetical protein DDX92_07020 [Flavobacteriales bacterium]|jgi:predicted alpha/beta superfamily hydrolase|nr:hypothetical protein [Flavobacteriales bacterium]